MPYWIFVYILITIPIGQALMRGLKYFEFSRKLKKRGESVFGEMLEATGLKEDEDEKKRESKGKSKKKKKGKSGGKKKDT